MSRRRHRIKLLSVLRENPDPKLYALAALHLARRLQASEKKAIEASNSGVAHE